MPPSRIWPRAGASARFTANRAARGTSGEAERQGILCGNVMLERARSQGNSGGVIPAGRPGSEHLDTAPGAELGLSRAEQCANRQKGLICPKLTTAQPMVRPGKAAVR